MKKLILLSALIALATGSWAQTEDDPEMKPDDRIGLEKGSDGIQVKIESRDSVPVNTKDTTKIVFDKSTIYIVTGGHNHDTDSMTVEEIRKQRKKNLTNWSGIDLGLNGFADTKGDLKLDDSREQLQVELARSRTLSINFWEEKLRLVDDYVGITTGAGIEWNSYKLKNDYILSATSDTLVAFIDSSRSVSKNKFRTTYINVPLLLEFNTSLKREKSLHLAAGVIGGLNVGTMFKQKYKIDDNRSRVKEKNDFNVNPFKLAATVRIGYGDFNLFATYNIIELFEPGKGPEIYPFSAGITMLAF